MSASTQFYDFLAQINYIKQQMRWWWLYVNSYSLEGATNLSAFSLHYSIILVFGCKNNAVQYRSLRWVKSHEKTDCDEGVTSYEWKKIKLTPLSERIYGPKLVQIAPRSTNKKSLCWTFNWQFYWSRSYVRLSMRRTREDTRGAP